jgi:hypothetical protein
VTDVIRVFSAACWPSWVMLSVMVSDGKKTKEGTMLWPPEPKPNWVTVADPPEVQTPTPATTKQAFDILAHCKYRFEIVHNFYEL